VRTHWLFFPLAALGLHAGAAGAADDALAQVRQLVGDLRVAVRSTADLQPAVSNKPPCKSETWVFDCGAAQPAIHYGRFLNRPPDFTGQYPSLVSGDMGIGFGNSKLGDAFGNWYGGNAIRVLVNETDIAAQQNAARIESASSEERGHLRMIWDLAGGGMLRLTFTVPADGRALYAQVDLAGAALTNPPALALALTCYPGGYGPAYKIPSHRVARTAGAEAGVPVDFSGTENPKLPIAAGQSWIFYEDRLASSGALGLVFPPEERAAGSVTLSNYGQATRLSYPAGTTACRLAFYAFDTDNANAWQTFSAMVNQEAGALRTMPFWTKEAAP
jgi:hypothetical protein